MERLTTNKPAEEMNMVELARNCCYIDKDRNARYRDFETDNDAREYARKLLIWYGLYSDELKNDDYFDEAMIDLLQSAPVELDGLIALFYRNLWAMAELRERLKRYEDAEEKGLLLRLPCKIKDTVYVFEREFFPSDDLLDIDWLVECRTIISEENFELWMIEEFGKTVFLTKEEAEKALERMKNERD